MEHSGSLPDGLKSVSRWRFLPWLLMLLVVMVGSCLGASVARAQSNSLYDFRCHVEETTGTAGRVVCTWQSSGTVSNAVVKFVVTKHTGTPTTTSVTISNAVSTKTAMTAVTDVAKVSHTVETITALGTTLTAHTRGLGPGSGHSTAVTGDHPADVWDQITDYGIENAPTIVAIIGGLFLVGLAFYLFRRGLMRARSAMRI